MFYWPYRFRRQTTYLVPKGPAYDFAPIIRTFVNGSEISLKVPRNSSRLAVKPLSPRKSYILNNNDFNSAVSSEPGWESFPLLARWLDFNGPWFTGNLARLGIFVNVMKPLHPNPQVSFFHPRAFESAVADLMRYYHSEELSRNNLVQDWLAPVEWQPLTNLPCIGVKFDAITNPEVRRSERCRYALLPLTDQYLLLLEFPVTRKLPFIHSSEEPEDDTDKWISEEPMKELADQILNSLQVRLSPEAEQQQARALERLSLEERVLVKEFPPLKWV